MTTASLALYASMKLLGKCAEVRNRIVVLQPPEKFFCASVRY